MSFRARLLLSFTPVVLVPLAVLALGVRTVLNARFREQFELQLTALVTTVNSDIRAIGVDLDRRTTAIAEAAAGDNRFRLAVSGGMNDRQYLLDYAENAMRLSGLGMLQFQDAEGRVLSSGHFRNQFDQTLPVVATRLSQSDLGVAVASVSTSSGTFHAIVRADSLRLGTRWLHLTAGVRLSDRLDVWTRSVADVSVEVVFPQDRTGTPPPRSAGLPDFVKDEVRIPYLEGERVIGDGVRLVLTHSLEPLRGLQRQVDRWTLLVFAVAGGVALAVAVLVAAKISRPIADLAQRTSSLDLDRLDVEFANDRQDEIGSLTRLLGSMVDRLRTSTSRLREFERRAAMGDMARQVNHDIKNGLVPIRNVIQHLTEVEREDPVKLPSVFAERRETIDSSIAYLENLASQYAKLTPDREHAVCDLNAVVREVIRGLNVPSHCRMEFRAQPQVQNVKGDRLALRRVVENLVGNAIDSLEGESGSVEIGTNRRDDTVILTVNDSGRGMQQDELDRAFQDFHTTKPGGTGLGLSVVRRLVGDLGGALRVQTKPGEGTKVLIELAAAGNGSVTS